MLQTKALFYPMVRLFRNIIGPIYTASRYTDDGSGKFLRNSSSCTWPYVTGSWNLPNTFISDQRIEQTFSLVKVNVLRRRKMADRLQQGYKERRPSQYD
jgi:hypothetical protein